MHRIVHGRGAGTARPTAQATPGIRHACELPQQPRQQPDPSSQVTVLQEDLRCAESLRPRALLHPRSLVPRHWRITGHAQVGPPQARQAELGRLTGQQAGDPQAPAGAGGVKSALAETPRLCLVGGQVGTGAGRPGRACGRGAHVSWCTSRYSSVPMNSCRPKSAILTTPLSKTCARQGRCQRARAPGRITPALHALQHGGHIALPAACPCL